MQNGDFLEIAAVDPDLGAVFYSVDQIESKKPQIIRATHQCMSCHETHKTQNVPSFLVRSVYPKKSGHPEFRLATIRTDHTTPIKDRFGGWYVTGSHGVLQFFARLHHRNRKTTDAECPFKQRIDRSI